MSNPRDATRLKLEGQAQKVRQEEVDFQFLLAHTFLLNTSQSTLLTDHRHRNPLLNRS